MLGVKTIQKIANFVQYIINCKQAHLAGGIPPAAGQGKKFLYFRQLVKKQAYLMIDD